jgi:hypothetical protein
LHLIGIPSLVCPLFQAGARILFATLPLPHPEL